MDNTTANGVRRDLETQLIEKAWKDPSFRQEVLQDPKGLLERHLGQKLPEQLKIFVHEEDAHTLHFSIPPAPANLTELSDEDLEKVAGGTEIWVTTLMVSGVVAGTVAASGVISGVASGAVVTTKQGW